MILLSICIPTYNRAKKLEKLLNKLEKEIILNKLEKEIEICISDNTSNDINKDIIEKKSKKLNIKYNKNYENKGFDYNLMMTTKLATGKYIWFCGDDDIILENALQNLLNILKNKESNIYILDGQLKYKNKLKKFNALKIKTKKIYNSFNQEELYEYIDNINNNLSFFCAFITSIVVEKELYLAQVIPKNLRNSAYDHMYKLLKILKNGCKLEYLDDEYYLVGITENIWNNETGKHFLLDITSLYKFINDLYPENNNDIREKIGILLSRCCGKFRMIYCLEYAKRKNREIELIEAMKYFKIYNKKNKIFKIFLSNALCIKIMNNIKKMRKGLFK